MGRNCAHSFLGWSFSDPNKAASKFKASKFHPLSFWVAPFQTPRIQPAKFKHQNFLLIVLWVAPFQTLKKQPGNLKIKASNFLDCSFSEPKKAASKLRVSNLFPLTFLGCSFSDPKKASSKLRPSIFLGCSFADPKNTVSKLKPSNFFPHLFGLFFFKPQEHSQEI